MHVGSIDVFELEEQRFADGDAADEEEEALQRTARVLSRAVHEGEQQQHRAELDAEEAGREHHVRRTDDAHVEAVRVVPPVVERRRHEHREPAPRREEGAGWPREAQDADAHVSQRRRAAERGRGDEIPGRDASQKAARVDRQMRRRPE